MGKKHQIQQSINKINPINPIAEHVSYSYEMVMKPPLATKMWRDTVGFGSRTNRVGTTRCRLWFALLGCVHVLLQVVLHRVRFLDHLNQNITPTRFRTFLGSRFLRGRRFLQTSPFLPWWLLDGRHRGPLRARRRRFLPWTTPSSLN